MRSALEEQGWRDAVQLPRRLCRLARAPRRVARRPGGAGGRGCPGRSPGGLRALFAEADSLLAIVAVSLGADPGGEPWRRMDDDPPPADLADRIVARVATERRSSRRRRSVVAVVAIAAAAVLLVVVTRDDAPTLDGEPVSFARVAPGVEAAATVAPDDAGSLVELTADGLDPAVTYALWLTPPGGGYPERVAAGTFRPDDDGRVDVTLRSALPAEEAGHGLGDNARGRRRCWTTES